jgi:hypothetical protein
LLYWQRRSISGYDGRFCFDFLNDKNNNKFTNKTMIFGPCLGAGFCYWRAGVEIKKLF